MCGVCSRSTRTEFRQWKALRGSLGLDWTARFEVAPIVTTKRGQMIASNNPSRQVDGCVHPLTPKKLAEGYPKQPVEENEIEVDLRNAKRQPFNGRPIQNEPSEATTSKVFKD